MHTSSGITRFDPSLRLLAWLSLALMTINLAGNTSAQAAVAASNLGNFHNGNFGISQQGSFTYGRAQAFTTGSDPMLLEAAILAMDSTGASGSGGFQVSLYSNSSGNLPETKLLPLSGSDTPIASGNYTFSATSEFTLAPATTYWIVAELPPNGPANTNYYWTFTVNFGESALPGWSLGSSADSTSFMGGTPNWGPQSIPLRMEIDVQPVPEPAVMSVLGLSMAGLLAVRRNRPFAEKLGR